MRYTYREAEEVFIRLARALDKPIFRGMDRAEVVGSWKLSNQPQYGGYVIQEIVSPSLATSTPLGDRRLSAKEFVYACELAILAVRLEQEKNQKYLKAIRASGYLAEAADAPVGMEPAPYPVTAGRFPWLP